MNFLLKQIIHLIQTYQNEYPLASFLRDYYRTQPQLGSRDRKAISEALYLYYRTNHILAGVPGIPERLATAYWLCESRNTFLGKMLPEIPRGLPVILPDLKEYPELSEGISHEEWTMSILQQPRVFIRIIKDETLAHRLLQENEIEFEEIQVSEFYTCLSIQNNAPIDRILPAELYAVQDWSSQKALLSAITKIKKADAIRSTWDTCAGAGGKSLLLSELLPGVHLTASDVRKSILTNLRERFRLYNYPLPTIRITDLTQAEQTGGKYDLVICDVPCSGSGTWARTPEQFYFSTIDGIEKFRKLQLPILSNSAGSVNKGGHLVYITCSVFRAENEEVIQSFLASNSDFELISSQLINGIAVKADVLFSAVFSRR